MRKILLICKIYAMHTCEPTLKETMLRQHINNNIDVYMKTIYGNIAMTLRQYCLSICNVVIWWQCFGNIQCYVGNNINNIN